MPMKVADFRARACCSVRRSISSVIRRTVSVKSWDALAAPLLAFGQRLLYGRFVKQCASNIFLPFVLQRALSYVLTGSIFATNTSVIGLATNVTPDPTDPAYQWIDQGLVLSSSSSDDCNAIDSSILVDTDGSVWMTYGSYWTGIKQQQLNPSTGKLMAANQTVYSLATRPAVLFDPIEGTSPVHKDNSYYLFASFDDCCNPNPYLDNYRVMVGRSNSPHGPFSDMNGTPMMQGGGTQQLRGVESRGTLRAEKPFSLIR